MPCFRPLDPSKFRVHTLDRPGTQVPCGQCIGCRLERSRQWAVRCMHEASLYDENSFVTLTYDDEHLPPGRSLDVSHFQKFMKRLRKVRSGEKIRFFHCGEYGETTSRPHYHALLFNCGFQDRKFFSGAEDRKLYTSDVLSKLWPFGFSTLGSVTFESASYVARYVMKKVTGVKAREHYGGRKAEYITMSRRPGIAAEWFNLFRGDVYPLDRVVCRGKDSRPPRFYDKLLDKVDPALLKSLKVARSKNERFVDTRGDGFLESDSSAARLAVKEICAEAKLSTLKRPLE